MRIAAVVLMLVLATAPAEARLAISARAEVRPEGSVLVLSVKNLGAAHWLWCQYDQFTQYGSLVGRRTVWNGGMSAYQLGLCGRHSQLWIVRGETHELVVKLPEVGDDGAADTTVTYDGKRFRIIQRGSARIRVARTRS